MNPTDLFIKGVRDAYDKYEYTFFDKGDYNLNIGAIRSSDMTPNVFNDPLFCIYKKDKVWQLRTWNGTTDPGLYWLKKPMRVEGTFILKSGQMRSGFKLGHHKGKYLALVQNLPMAGYRDANRDGVLNLVESTLHTGMFGINIHMAGVWSKWVEKWSAGCQVFQRKADFNEFMNIVCKSAERYGEIFTYTLLNECELELKLCA